MVPPSPAARPARLWFAVCVAASSCAAAGTGGNGGGAEQLDAEQCSVAAAAELFNWSTNLLRQPLAAPRSAAATADDRRTAIVPRQSTHAALVAAEEAASAGRLMPAVRSGDAVPPPRRNPAVPERAMLAIGDRVIPRGTAAQQQPPLGLGYELTAFVRPIPLDLDLLPPPTRLEPPPPLVGGAAQWVPEAAAGGRAAMVALRTDLALREQERGAEGETTALTLAGSALLQPHRLALWVVDQSVAALLPRPQAGAQPPALPPAEWPVAGRRAQV
jgi:hypothetical protein